MRWHLGFLALLVTTLLLPAKSIVQKGELLADGQLSQDGEKTARSRALQLGGQPIVSFVLSDTLATGMLPVMSHEIWMHRDHLKMHTAYLRCIFGNPFRPSAMDSAWQTSTVQRLAETAYLNRVFDHLPILADALEDAGCTNADILQSLPPTRRARFGCWVVDLLLNKE